MKAATVILLGLAGAAHGWITDDGPQVILGFFVVLLGFSFAFARDHGINARASETLNAAPLGYVRIDETARDRRPVA